MNIMKNIRIGKVTLNFGAGKDQAKLDKGVLLLKAITGIDPVKTSTTKRIPTWGIRPGLPIGCKITLRGSAAKELLARLLSARDNLLEEKQFDKEGNLAFGVPEYIDIPGVKYDPKIGIAGLEVCVTFERPGFRIKKRRIKKSKVPQKHRVKKEESMEFMKKEFGIRVGEE